MVACESGDHAKPHGVDGRPPEALPPRRGHQHGAAAAPGWEPNRGAGESILIQARGSKAYKGVDAYLVTRGANGYEFAPVGKEAVRKGRSAGLAA